MDLMVFVQLLGEIYLMKLLGPHPITYIGWVHTRKVFIIIREVVVAFGFYFNITLVMTFLCCGVQYDMMVSIEVLFQ